MKRTLAIVTILFLSLCVIVSASGADEFFAQSGYRDIIDLGCDNLGECWLTVANEGGAFNLPENCTGTIPAYPTQKQFRWDITKTPNGRGILALLMSAQVTGKKVNLGYCTIDHPEPCYTTHGGASAPTFVWVHVLTDPAKPLNGLPVY